MKFNKQAKNTKGGVEGGHGGAIGGKGRKWGMQFVLFAW